MDKQGRRFADDNGIIEFPAAKADSSDDKQKKREEKLKEKNSKKLEKKLKKSRNKDKSVRKDVSSSEAVSTEEAEIEKKRRSSKLNKKQMVAAVVIVLALFIVVFFAANPEKLSYKSISNFINYGILNKNSEESFPLQIQSENINAGNFVRIGQDICYSSDTATKQYNSYGKTVFSAQHAYINPILCTSSKKALVYNLGSTGFQIIADNAVEYSGEAPDNILVADINENGIYALVTQSSGYLSKLYVYDESNTQIYAYSFADYYVTSVSLNSNGRKAVVSGISVLDGVNISSLYVLDFTKDTPVYLSEFENNIIYTVSYLNDTYACAIGRSASYSINTSNGSVEEYAYEGKAITAFDINTDTDTYTLSLSNSGDGRNCEIVSFNSNGKKDKSFTVEDKIIDLSSYKGRLALLNSDEVILCSKDGAEYNRKALKSDPHSVVLYTGSDAYVLCTGYIDTVSM